MLIDTHAHLNFKDYNDIEEVIERSINAGVGKIVCVSSNVGDSVNAIAIAKKHPGVVFVAAGIHPQCTDPNNKDGLIVQLEKLEGLVLENKDVVVAIGECGLDFTDVLEGERRRGLEEQELLFRGQIDLARKHSLPILLHFNKAHDYFLDNYQDLKDSRGCFHCYAGGKKRLKKFIEFDRFMFGVTGLVTYDDGLQQVIKEIPLDRIVLETDCPFLAPMPYRGERNEPAYIPLIADKLSDVLEVDSGAIEAQTTKNAEEIFGI